MGIWDSIKGTAVNHAKAQFLDVIQWMEDDRQTLVYRFPVFNQAIQDGGKLVVREGQAAVFVNEGVASEAFGPGTYELSTRTKAISSFFDTIKYALNYPYKGDIFFVSTRQFTGQKWGTPSPVLIEDESFGMIEARAFGTYSFKVADPVKFLRELVGNRGTYETSEISTQLKSDLLNYFSDSLGEMGTINVARLLGQTVDLANAVSARIDEKFNELYGVKLANFAISSVNIPEEIRKEMRAIDMDRARMRRMGGAIDEMGENFQKYQQHRMVGAIDSAAGREGAANPMMDAGMGLAMGNMMGGMMGGAMGNQQAPAAAPPPPPAAVLHYNGSAGQGQFSPQEIAEKIAANRTGNHNIWAQGWSGWKAWTDVPEVASLVPPEQAAPPPLSDVVFHYSGPSGQAELPASAIAEKLRADPSARHLVWRQGFSNWIPAQESPEIQAAMNAGPPPLPPSGGPPPPPI
jgi:membrane protease subunit (stomatin/prohibitin family)